MPLWVFDPNLNAIGIIDGYQYLSWTRDFRGIGAMKLEVAKELALDNLGNSLVQPGNFFGLYRNGWWRIARITQGGISWKSDDTTNSDIWSITCGDGKGILNQRLCLFGTTTGTGYNSLATDAETVIRTLITEEMMTNANTDRNIPQLALETVNQCRGGTVTIDARFDYVMDTITEILQQSGTMGMEVRMNPGSVPPTLVPTMILGTDRTQSVFFTPKFSNVKELDYTFDISKSRNAALVAGSGTAAARTQSWVTVDNSFYQMGRLGTETKVSAMVDCGNGILVAGSAPDGYIFRSTNNGSTWTQIVQLDTAAVSSLLFVNNMILAGTSPNAKLWVSYDFGLTWTLLTTLTDGSTIINYLACDGRPHTITTSQATTSGTINDIETVGWTGAINVYAGTGGSGKGTVWIANVNALSAWSGLGALSGGDSAVTAMIYAGTPGANGAPTWSEHCTIDLTPIPTNPKGCMVASGTTGNIYWYGSALTSITTVWLQMGPESIGYQTAVWGAWQWNLIGNLPGVTSVSSFLAASNGDVLAGCSPGGQVYRCSGGLTSCQNLINPAQWSYVTRLGTGTLTVSCMVDGGQGLVYAGVSGGTNAQVYRSLDYGTTWTSLGNVGTETGVFALDLSPTGYLVLSTYPTGSIYQAMNVSLAKIPTGINRSEILVDASDAQSAGTITAQGAQTITDLAEVDTLNCILQPGSSTFVYGTDFDLGDMVTVVYPGIVQKSARILVITEEYSLTDGFSDTITLGSTGTDLGSVIKKANKANSKAKRK
jgi:hypothetical protein